EFVGDKFQPIRKFLKRRVIAVVGGDALGDAAHRSFRRRVKKAEMQAERIAGQREHVPELSAAENAQGHCRFPFCEFFMGTATAETEGSGCARTRSACSTRNFRNASRISGCFAPRIAAASKASLIGPALPIVSVPSGRLTGFCATEQRASRPFSIYDSYGTP